MTKGKSKNNQNFFHPNIPPRLPLLRLPVPTHREGLGRGLIPNKQ